MTKRNRFVDGDVALVGKVPGDGDLRPAIDQAVAAIGGFERLVRPGDTLLVKPNFNTADPPPASSDPAFVKAAIELLYSYGAGKVILGESSKFLLSTRRVLQETGMLRAAEEAGAEVVCFDEGEWAPVTTGGVHLRRFGVARRAVEAEKVVYLCCLKTHRYAGFTMSLKAAMGCVRTRDRVGMHLWHLAEKLVDLNLVLRPDLILVDGRRCFISGGPSSGTVREPNLILASGDPIAVDVEGLKIIQSYPGHSLEGGPWAQAMIRRAVELGLGAASEAGYRVVPASR